MKSVRGGAQNFSKQSFFSQSEVVVQFLLNLSNFLLRGSLSTILLVKDCFFFFLASVQSVGPVCTALSKLLGLRSSSIKNTMAHPVETAANKNITVFIICKTVKTRFDTTDLRQLQGLRVFASDKRW